MIKRSLRKGSDQGHFQHEHVSNTITMRDTFVAIAGESAVLSFTLKPSGENQHIDEDYFHDHELQSVQFTDKTIIESYRDFCSRHSDQITDGLRLRVISKGKTFSYRITRISPPQEHFLELTLSSEA